MTTARAHHAESAVAVKPGEFEVEKHYYTRVLNASIHPLVHSFFDLSNERIIQRYCHLNPKVTAARLTELLSYQCQFFRWAGSDLFNVTTGEGLRKMVIIETNSCPSGQKSMPLLNETEHVGGYGTLMDYTYLPLIQEAVAKFPDYDLAVVYDKNPMEASGYAATLADRVGRSVWFVEFYEDDPNPPVRWVRPADCAGDYDLLMEVRTPEGVWRPVSACFRYVTQKPWSRFPLISRTVVLNPVLACLAGGRNKMMASKAYDFFNAELDSTNTGVRIETPETIKDVSRFEIPLWVRSFGGHAVVKVPYSNAGQGVYTITSEKELQDFMKEKTHYDKYIVQSLVGNSSWSSVTRAGKFYHVGTIPNKRGQIYVADLRMMVANSAKGFKPIAMYARKAHEPLSQHLEKDVSQFSWRQLGTNLSCKAEDGSWSTETNRLLLMDRKDFNALGVGIDDLIEAYVQTVLTVIAIDKLCMRLTEGPGLFNKDLFRSLNDDAVLLDELMKSSLV